MSIFFIIILLSIVVPDLFISLVGDETQHHFLEDLVLYISKGYRSLFHLRKCLVIEVSIMPMPLSFISFPLCLGEEVILMMVRKIMDLHVLFNFAFVIIMATSFDLWMSKGGANTFAFVFNYLNELWTSMHLLLVSLRCMTQHVFPWLGSCKLYLKSLI
jgi:hypothetical protein